jgi:hypothetical protein
MGNHRLAPIYENWQWGAGYGGNNYRQALQELDEKYPSLERYAAMQKVAVDEIMQSPGVFGLRVLTRLSVLAAFDSSPGAEDWHRGYRIRAIVLIGMMLVISLSTKAAAVVGTSGTTWPKRHLIWLVLLGFSIPHLIAYAHPSYSQMFMDVAVPVIGLAAANVSVERLRVSKVWVVLVAALVLCNVTFIYHMIHTRLAAP